MTRYAMSVGIFSSLNQASMSGFQFVNGDHSVLPSAEDVDAEVRAHDKCKEHQLHYRGILWECRNNQLEFQPSWGETVRTLQVAYTQISWR
jgi:hypothetical protein